MVSRPGGADTHSVEQPLAQLNGLATGKPRAMPHGPETTASYTPNGKQNRSVSRPTSIFFSLRSFSMPFRSHRFPLSVLKACRRKTVTVLHEECLCWIGKLDPEPLKLLHHPEIDALLDVHVTAVITGLHDVHHIIIEPGIVKRSKMHPVKGYSFRCPDDLGNDDGTCSASRSGVSRRR